MPFAEAGALMHPGGKTFFVRRQEYWNMEVSEEFPWKVCASCHVQG